MINAVKRYFLRFFRILWGAYGITLLVILISTTLLTVGLARLIFRADPVSLAYRISKVYILPVFFTCCLIRVKILNRHLIQKNTAYVIISNHTSFLDILCNVYAYPFTLNFLSKAENVRIPLAGPFVNWYSVLVERGNSRSRQKSFMQMAEILRQGISIMIYPEGTRNTGKSLLNRFHDGAFRLAISTGTPLVVLTLVNTGKLANPKRYVSLKPGTIYCVYDEPIQTAGMSTENIEYLKTTAREQMRKTLETFQN